MFGFYSVTIVPTCSIADNEKDDTLSSLDYNDYSMLNTVLKTQRQLSAEGRAVHAFVGPPCMTGLCSFFKNITTMMNTQ
jgi:hypothetical protein